MKRSIIRASLAIILGLSGIVILVLLWHSPGAGRPVARAASYTVCPAGLPTCDYSTIQTAVDAASDGDVIKVATGVYTDVQSRPILPGHYGSPVITQVVYISKSVTIQGGYTITNWTTSDPEANPTTLDAQGQGRVLYITGDISPTVEGLRITGGDVYTGWGGGGGVYVSTATVIFSDNVIYSNTVNNRGSRRGGGVYLIHSAATLNGNTVISNTAQWHGGGLYLWDSPATLSGNTIRGNIAGVGGGLYLKDSPATLSGNIIRGNTANSRGGGLDLYQSPATLSGNTITLNTANYCGGGLYMFHSTATLNGNTVISNTALFGGGLFLTTRPEISYGCYSPTIVVAMLVNNLVADNQATVGSGLYIEGYAPRLLHTTIARNTGGDGSGVYVTGHGGFDEWSGRPFYQPSTVVLTNTILVSHTVGITVASGNTATLAATLWGSGDWANGTNWSGMGVIIHTHDITGDPAFVDPNAGDYHIGLTSAALNAGVDAGVTTDIDGDVRPIGAGFDLGADECTGADLSLSRKTSRSEDVGAGQVLTYTILLFNSGVTSATNTVLFDAIPAHTAYISGSAWATSGVLTDVGGITGTLIYTGGIAWSGTITPDEAITITFPVIVNERVFIENTAIITDQFGASIYLTAWVNAWRVYLPLVLRR